MSKSFYRKKNLYWEEAQSSMAANPEEDYLTKFSKEKYIRYQGIDIPIVDHSLQYKHQFSTNYIEYVDQALLDGLFMAQNYTDKNRFIHLTAQRLLELNQEKTRANKLEKELICLRRNLLKRKNRTILYDKVPHNLSFEGLSDILYLDNSYRKKCLEYFPPEITTTIYKMAKNSYYQELNSIHQKIAHYEYREDTPYYTKVCLRPWDYTYFSPEEISLLFDRGLVHSLYYNFHTIRGLDVEIQEMLNEKMDSQVDIIIHSTVPRWQEIYDGHNIVDCKIIYHKQVWLIEEPGWINTRLQPTEVKHLTPDEWHLTRNISTTFYEEHMDYEKIFENSKVMIFLNTFYKWTYGPIGTPYKSPFGFDTINLTDRQNSEEFEIE